MDQPSAAQQVYAACSQVVEVTAAKARTARSYVLATWTNNKPSTLIGWTTFIGACLLFLSALSTVLAILSGFLLSLAWLGVVVYSVLVAVSTAGAFVAGGATLLFSGICAVMGTCILSCACTAYITQAVFLRIRAVAQGYLGTTQSSALQDARPLHAQPLLSPQPAAHVSATHTASTAAPADSSSSAPLLATSQYSAEAAGLSVRSVAVEKLVHVSAKTDAAAATGLSTKAAALAPAAAANGSYASPKKASKVMMSGAKPGTANGVAGVVSPAMGTHVL